MELKKLKNITKIIKDAIFPKFCIYCRNEGLLICSECKQHLDPEIILACPTCRKNNARGGTCQECSSSIDRQVSIFNYKNEDIKTLIHRFKYEYVTQILDSIRSIISDFLEDYSHLFPDQADIVPVPLHKKRQAERGFNQAEMIGEILSEELDFTQFKALRRVRNTKQQADLNKKSRLNNVIGAFKLKKTIEVQKIILVDDVFTTGATLQECAQEIKQNSEVETIIGFTLARGF